MLGLPRLCVRCRSYNAALWCFNLTPQWAVTMPMPPQLQEQASAQPVTPADDAIAAAVSSASCDRASPSHGSCGNGSTQMADSLATAAYASFTASEESTSNSDGRVGVQRKRRRRGRNTARHAAEAVAVDA